MHIKKKPIRRSPPDLMRLVCVFLLAGFWTARAQPTMRSASESDVPPFSSMIRSGSPSSFSSDLLRETLNAMGAAVEFQTSPWAEIKLALVDGRLEKESNWKTIRSYLLGGAALIVLLAAGSVLIVASLRQQVKRKTADLSRANTFLGESRQTALQMMAEAIEAKERLEITQFALDHAADPAFWIRSDGSLAYVNRAACQSLGYTREELLTRSIPDFDPTFDFSRWPEQWENMKTRKSAVIETCHKTRQGHIFPVEVHITYMKYGNEEYHFTFAHDTSRRKQSETTLKELNNLQSLILDSSSLGIALIRADRFVWVNPRVCELSGIPENELKGAPAHRLYPNHEAYEQTRDDAFSVMRSGERFDGQVRLLRNDGTLFWARLIATAIDPENLDNGTLWMVEDITATKASEEQLQLLSTTIEQSPEIIVITDTEGTIEYVNPSFEKITGYRSQEVIGSNPRILKSGHQDRAFYEQLWNTILSGNVWNGRLVNRRKNGNLYTEEALISPVMNTEGEICNFVAVKRDISNEIILEEELRQSQKMEAVGQLAGGIAHDFNNILQIIHGFGQLLQLNIDPKSEDGESLAEILKASNRAGNLTAQLLTFSRRRSADRALVNLNEIVTEAKGLIQMLLGEQFTLAFHLDRNLHPIRTDHGQITQIIMNLAVNARDAMGESGKLTISTENILIGPDEHAAMPASRPGSFICLSIADTGCGIDDEIKDRLFEPFFTTKGVGKGSGLGLSVVYGIIQQNTGWIMVHSEKHQGTCFKIYFPAADSGEPDREPPAGATTRRRILLIEREPETAHENLETLRQAGFEVAHAATGLEALALLDAADAPFDLLISDLVLPDMAGKQLYDEVRMHARIPILFYSGYQDIKNRWAEIPDDHCFFTHKTFTARELIDTINNALA